jgi:hypothetical protein
MEESNMSGKGSKPRPFSVDEKTFVENWNNVFDKEKTLDRNNYQDILSTEDCVLDAFEGIDNDK